MNPLHQPLRFAPQFNYRVWGGNRLKHLLNKPISDNNIGESWELSAVPGAASVVCEGPLEGKTLQELIAFYQTELLGEHIWRDFGSNFPLLIKFIDAQNPLSLQVHPNDAWAKEHHNSFGKNEMWYILDAEPNAHLTLGFNRQMTPQAFEEHLQNGTLETVLHTQKAEAGQAYFIPSGRVHAIGGGIVLAEIQQTSDITYRMYDYNRKDPVSGKQRPLHMEEAKAVADWTPTEQFDILYGKHSNHVNPLIHTSYFCTNYLTINGGMARDYSDKDTFVILIGIAGELEIQYATNTITLRKGETLLLPAAMASVSFVGENATLLEVMMP